MIDAYFKKEDDAIMVLEGELESLQAEITEMEEEHAGDEGLLEDAANSRGGLSKTNVSKYVKELKDDPSEKETYKLAKKAMRLLKDEHKKKKEISIAEKELDDLCLQQYPKLNEEDVKKLVVEDKWMGILEEDIGFEVEAISQGLTGRIQELAKRYENTLGELDSQIQTMEEKVATHLENMGLSWS